MRVATRRTHGRGQSLVEFALVVPLLALLLLGAVDMGRLFHLYISVKNAAREGAAYGAFHPTCITSTNCLSVNGGASSDPDNVTYQARKELGSGTDASVTVNVSCSASCSTASSVGSPNTMSVTISKPFAIWTPIISQIVGSSLIIGSSATAVIQ